MIMNRLKKRLGVVLAVMTFSVSALPVFAINPADIPADAWVQNPANGQTSTYDIETTYTGLVSHKDYHDKVISDKYGSYAKDLFVQGLKTGDMVPFRNYIGDFDNGLDQWLNDGWNVPTLDNAEYLIHWAESFGPYGTAQDYISWAWSVGHDPFDHYTHNQFVADLVYGKIAWPDKITKEQYHKNHGKAASSKVELSSSIEALKSYNGNNAEFNAYSYYTRYTDLQSAIGVDGDALFKHFNEFGKAEGRIGN